MIGGWGNTRSVFRKRKLGHELAESKNPEGLCNGRWKWYWVLIDQSTISYGIGERVRENQMLTAAAHELATLSEIYVGFGNYNTPVSLKDITVKN